MIEKTIIKSGNTNLNETNVSVFPEQEEIFEGIISQLGPSVVDEETSGYASAFLQTAEPTDGKAAKRPPTTKVSTFTKEESGYFVSDDANTVRQALDQLGPSVTDAELSSYIAQVLGERTV